MGAGAYGTLVKWLLEMQAKHPGITKAAEDVAKEQAGPYGQAIREREGELWKEVRDMWKAGPQKVGEDYPFFPPGVFSPYPKAFDEQGDLSLNDSGGRGGGVVPGEEIDRLVARVLGERTGERDDA